jgi:signal transduction histidine kinase
MEMPTKPKGDEPQVIARAEALVLALKQLYWFGFAKAETIAFLYYWTYHRYLRMGTAGVFEGLQKDNAGRGNASGQEAALDFSEFLDHCFSRYLTAAQRSTIADIQVQSGLAQLLNNLETIANHHSDQEFAADFEYFIRTVMGRGTFDTPMPAPLAMMLVRLYDLPANAVIANPYAGNGALIPYLPPKSTYQAESTDAQDNAILALRLLIHGFAHTLVEPPKILSTNPQKADWTISFPAFDREYVALPRKPKETPAEVSQKLVRNLLMQTHETGKVLLVVLDRNLAEDTRGAMALQKALATSGFLEAVISLPADLFDSAGMKASIVVLDKARNRNAPIKLMDAATWRADYKSPEEIDLRLTIERFRSTATQNEVFFAKRETLVAWQFKPSISKARLERRIAQELAQLPAGEKLVTLGSLLQKPKWETGTPAGMPKITIPYLQDPLRGNRMGGDDLAKFPLLAPADKQFQVVKLTRPLILVPKYIAGARPTLLDATGTRVAIHETVLAFHVDAPSVDLEFLAFEMNSGFFSDQLKEVNSYALQPALSIPDFLALKVRIPTTLAQQKRRLDEFRNVSQAVRLKEANLIQRVEGLQQTEQQMLAVLGHELRPLLANVRTLSALTKRYIQTQSDASASVSMGDKLSPRPKSPSIERAYEYIDADLQRMGMLFDSLRGLMASDRSKMTLTEIPLLDCLQAFTAQLADQLRDAQFFCAADPIWTIEQIRPLVTIDQELLLLALRNIVENAFEHGFEEGAPGNSIVFYLSCITDEDAATWVAIDAFNNGKPFPEDFSLDKYTQFGGRQGKSKGTGIGGFLVKRIVENHEGQLRMMTTRDIAHAITNIVASVEMPGTPLQAGDRPFLVGLRILLPYHLQENEQLD